MKENPFKKRVATEAKPVATPKVQKASKPEKAAAPAEPKKLPWKTWEDITNAFLKGSPSEEVLKGHAKTLGIEYNSNFEEFYDAALKAFDKLK